MLTCKKCNSEIDSPVIVSASGFEKFYQCRGCSWWTQQIDGTPIKGNTPRKFLLYSHAPFDLVTQDIAEVLNKALAGNPDALGFAPIHKEIAVFTKGIVLRFLKEFAEAAEVSEQDTLNWAVINGLHPARPEREFHEEK